MGFELTGDWGEGSRSKSSTPSRGHTKSKDRSAVRWSLGTGGNDDGVTVRGVSESRTGHPLVQRTGAVFGRQDIGQDVG